MSRQVTYIISSIDRWIAFEWIVEKIDKRKASLSFILLNSKNSYFEKYLINNDIPFRSFQYSSKFQWPLLIYKVARTLNYFRTEIAHTHFLDANVLGLISAWITGVRERIHTRHHSVFHHQFARKGVFIDKLCNQLSTKIVSISPVVSRILVEKEGVNPDKIVLIRHGFDLDQFLYLDGKRTQKLREKYDITSQYPVLGVVSRHIEWKGVQYTIEAFKQILKSYPDSLLILANARGPFKQALTKLSSTIPEKNIRWIPFENDLYSLFHLFDVFIHVPISEDVEAFGQIYVEALASKIPSIFTISGIANDFIEDGINSLVVPYKDSDSIVEAVNKIFSSGELSKRIAERGLLDVKERFTLDRMIRGLEDLYYQV